VTEHSDQPPLPSGAPDTPEAAALTRRLALAMEANPEDVSSPSLWRLVAESEVVLEPLRRLRRTIDAAPAAHPQTVMLLPGFATHPVRMRYMAKQLEKAGHTVKRWGMGFNWGATQERLEALEHRLDDINLRYDQPVVLVGWSLGGLFARELAKLHPDKVAKVITMGSPFSGSMRANNAWRAYQFVTGHRVDRPPIDAHLHEKPPVETVALWSPRDGIVSPRSACGRDGERDRAIALRCSHLDFAYSPESIAAVLRELDSV